MIGNMTVGARLRVDVCKTSCGGDGDEKEEWFYATVEMYWTGGKWLDLSWHSAWLGGVHLRQTFVVCSSGTCVCVWVCNTKVVVMYVCPQWSGWMSDHPDGVKSPIGGAEPGICAWFSFVQYVCVSVCVVGMCTLILECVLMVPHSYLWYSVFLSRYWCIGWLLNRFL